MKWFFLFVTVLVVAVVIWIKKTTARTKMKALDMDNYHKLNQAQMIMTMAYLNFKNRDEVIYKQWHDCTTMLQINYEHKFKAKIPTSRLEILMTLAALCDGKKALATDQNLNEDECKKKIDEIDQLIRAFSHLANSLTV